MKKKAKISKDIKAECKSNLLQKKKLTGKKDFSRFLYILNKTKKQKEKNRKNNITVPFMIGAAKGVAALPVTIALCLCSLKAEKKNMNNMLLKESPD